MEEVVRVTDFGLCQSTFGVKRGRATDEVVTRWWRSPDLQCGLKSGFSPAADMWSVGLIFVQLYFGILVFGDVADDASLVTAIAERIGWPEDFRASLRRRSGCPRARDFEPSSPLMHRCHELDAKTAPQKNDLELARSLLGSEYDVWREYYGDPHFTAIWHWISELLQVVPWRRNLEAARAFLANAGLVDILPKDEQKKYIFDTKLVVFDHARFRDLSYKTRQHAERLYSRTARIVYDYGGLCDCIANLSSKFMYDHIVSEQWNSTMRSRILPLEPDVLKALGYDLWA